jgi:5-methylcytosine-specific restriction endonuclease McrA
MLSVSKPKRRVQRDPLAMRLFRATFENRCVICSWTSGVCDIHHIRPLARGGTNAQSNLVYLCPSCHRLAGTGVINEARLRHARSNMTRMRAPSRGELLSGILGSKRQETAGARTKVR